MKGRKIVTVLLCIAILLSLVITGCSSKGVAISREESNAKIDLSGRIFKVGIEKLPKEGTEDFQAWNERMENIKTQFNCGIEFVMVNNDTYDTIFSSTLSGNPIVDIAPLGQVGWFYPNAKINMFYSLDDLKAIDLKEDKWDTISKEIFQYEGKHYGLLTNTPTLGQMVFFNKDLLKRSGITEDIYDLQKNGEWTLDKMIEIAKKVTKRTADKKNDIYGIVEDEFSLLRHLVVSYGVDFIKEKDGKFSFGLDDPKALEALTLYQKLNSVDKILLPLEDESLSDRAYGKNLFVDGKAAFIISYPRFTDVLEMMTDDFGAVLFPKLKKDGKYISIFDWPLMNYIPSTVKDPQSVGVFANEYFAPYNDDYKGKKAIEKFKVSNSKLYRDSRVLNETFELAFSGGVVPQKYFMFFDGDDVWDKESGIYTLYRDLSMGVKTPASAIEALLPRANSIINSKFEKK